MYVAEGNNQEQIKSLVTTLLQKQGILADRINVRSLKGGSNNRVAIIETGSHKYILKKYYTSACDTRERLRHEWEFLSYAYDINNHCVPKPIAFEADNNIGVYEYITGRKIKESEINASYIDEMVSFVQTLNFPHREKKGNKLLNASEACFSIRDHINLLGQRVQKLAQIETHEDFQKKISEFVNIIKHYFVEIKNSTQISCNKKEISYIDKLEYEERCISPSDFGFHNTLLANNKLVFIDFEYAGWDDPAKLIADFFCQPEIPVPVTYFDDFASGVLGYLKGNQALHLERTKILLPIFKLKWCCIMLNEFLPDAWKRRNFAKSIKYECYLEQISKVEKSLNEIKIH